MRALIDASGWPEALAYYEMFPHEPSASPALDIHIDRIVPIEQITLEKVLDAMLAVDEAGGDQILIVAHGTVEEGSPGGLSMPLAENCAVDAMRDAVRALTEAAVAVRETASDPLAWTRFIENPLDRRNVQASGTREQAPALFQKWLQTRARSLDLSKERLLEIVAKRNRIADRAFERVEIRACNLGAFPDAMRVLREFFGAQSLLAPQVITLSGSLRVHILEDLNQYQEWIQSRGGVGATDAFAEMESANGRCFGEAFCLRIQEASPESYRFELEAAALSEQAVQSWVEDYIMPGSAFSGVGALKVAALWTLGRPGHPQPYVLPGEDAYRGLIASEPV
jgi:hypothetical protein